MFIPADIHDKFEMQVSKLKKQKEIESCETEVLGGGRIEHKPDEKHIKVYGYSQVSIIDIKPFCGQRISELNLIYSFDVHCCGASV